MLQRFIRNARCSWLAGVTIACAITVGLAGSAMGATTITSNGTVATIDNGRLAVSVTLSNGAWSGKLNGTTVFSSLSASGAHNSTSGFTTTVGDAAVSNGVGQGRAMTLTSKATAGCKLTITEYDNEYFFLVDWTDSSGGTVTYTGTFNSGAPRNISTWYHDPSYWARKYRPIVKRLGTTGSQISQFAVAGWDGDDRPGLMVGSVGIDARNQRTSLAGVSAGMKFTASCDLASTKAQTFAFFAAPANTPAVQLTMLIERYGALCRILNNIQINSWIPAGWCSWDHYDDGVTQQNIFDASDAMVSTGLKDHGMTLIQIDDGWQKGWRASGDWAPNPKFTANNGMRGTGDYIHSKGLLAGLWVGPFCDEDNPVTWKNPPEYNGYQHLNFTTPAPTTGMQRYDLYNSNFLAWVGGTLMATITGTGTVAGQQAWGFDYVKTDFLYNSNGNDQQYRNAMQTMKAGMRAGTFLLHCNGKQFMGLGIGDSTRTGDDVGVTFNYFGGSNSVLPAIESSAYQWYANRNLFINDSDQVHVNSNLTDAEARSWATIVGLSGGVVITGDQFWSLPANRLDMLKRICPAYGVAARPADMFEKAMTSQNTSGYFPTIFVMPVVKPWGTSYVVAVYNWESSTVAKTLDLTKRLGTAAGQTFAAYEFWSAGYLGAVTGSMPVSVPSHDVKCFVLVPVPSKPQVISTNRHITHGGVDLVSQSYDAGAAKLSGASQNVVKGSTYTLVLYQPNGYAAVSAKIDGAPATVTTSADGATRISGTVTSTTTPAWEVSFTGPPSVAGRYAFYNNSKWDGSNAAANSSDDAAIATDKVALLPGNHTGAFANITSYSRGLNGVMVDIPSTPGTPVAADFGFKVGNSNTPGSWTTAPAPTSVTVRKGAGVNGSDRVTIIWADNAILNTWLEVTVKATAATGIAGNDVFYFGNAAGASGDSITASTLKVTATDEVNCRNNAHTGLNPSVISDVYDFNRDQRVNATDQIISRNNVNTDATAVKLITVP